MVWTLVVVTLILVSAYNRLFDRRQAAANAAGWMPLASLVAGQVKGNGVQGIYHGRLVTARIDVSNIGSYRAIEAASSSWVYVLTISGPPSGRNWEVDYSGAQPLPFGGDETVWRQVLSGVDLDGWHGAGLYALSYHAHKGELSGSFRLKTITLGSDLKEVVGAKSPPPPTPAVFAAQLDTLMRLAEVNQAVNQQP